MQVFLMLVLLGLICLCVSTLRKPVMFRGRDVSEALTVALVTLGMCVLLAWGTDHEDLDSYQPFAPVLVCHGTGCT